METSNFSELLENINKDNSSKDKKTLVQTAAAKNNFDCSQITELLDEFSFSKEKLQVLEILRPHISDIENTFQIMDEFTFVKDKEKASKLLGQPTNVESAVKILARTESSDEMPAAMKESDFSGLLDALGGHNFPKKKLCIIEVAAFRNTFTCDQVGQIFDAFQFSQHKLKALKILRYRMIDPENNFLLISAFASSLDKKKAKVLLNSVH